MPSISSLVAASARAWSWLKDQLAPPPGLSLGPRPGLIAAFRRDKLLFWVTVGMSLFALAPMAFATFLPLGDLPDTACFSALVPEIVFGHGLPSKVYYINWKPMPYWGPAVLIGAISSVSNVLVAIKVVVGALVLLLPLGVMRLMIATGRDPRVGLIAFAFSWEHSLYGGWISYVMGMVLTLWALAWLIEVETVKGALRVALLGLVIGLTHAQATLYYVLSTIVLTIARARPKPLRRFALYGLTGLGLALVFLPWIFSVHADGDTSTGTVSGILKSLANTDDPLHDKMRDMFRFSFENYTRRDDLLAAARTFGMLLAAPALLSLLPSRPGASRAVPLTLFLVSTALYVILPMTLTGGPVYQWYVYPRNAAYMLITMLLLARPDVSGRRIAWLLPGIAIVLALHVRVASQFKDWDKRTAPFLDLANAVRKESRVLPLEMDDSDPAVKWHIVNQMHAYIAALRSSYEPHMWRHPNMPYQYRPETDLPQTESVGGGDAFDLEKYGPHYDYILVQGKKNDPVQKQLETENFRVQLLKDTEVFRLYEVHRKKAPPGATPPPAGAPPAAGPSAPPPKK